MSLGALAVLVWENNRMATRDKRLLYLTYALIAFSTLVEWWGGMLDGATGLPEWALPAVKCVDYIVKPMAGGALVAQMHPHDRWLTTLIGVLVLNTVVQVASVFNGWMVVVDGQGHYAHGILYPAYLTACLAVVILVTVESVIYGRGFSRQNRVSLCVVMLFVVAGIAMQVLLPLKPKAVCVAMAMGSSLMFIRYAEFSSLEMDERLVAQRAQIDTDALTGVLSRQAYSRELASYDEAGSLPEDLVAFAVDINGLKQVNDTLGHEAGDELIVGAARCLKASFGGASRCYRTGGDEFVVLAHMSGEEAEEMLRRLERETRAWRGRLVSGVTLSVGHALASECEDGIAERLVREADLAMYAAKAAYYRDIGRDRRQR
jgi:diguanylate cyclase (GGDEF)-like protein